MRRGILSSSRCYRIEVWRKKTRTVKDAETPAEIYTEEPMSLGSQVTILKWLSTGAHCRETAQSAT